MKNRRHLYWLYVEGRAFEGDTTQPWDAWCLFPVAPVLREVEGFLLSDSFRCTSPEYSKRQAGRRDHLPARKGVVHHHLPSVIPYACKS